MCDMFAGCLRRNSSGNCLSEKIVKLGSGGISFPVFDLLTSSIIG